MPRLSNLASEVAGEGLAVTVRFTKTSGLPVRLVGADDPSEASAVREIDLRRKYHMSRTELAKRVGLSSPKATVLRRYLGIDEDPSCMYEFQFGSVSHPSYSDNAARKMEDAVKRLDMDVIWHENRTIGERRRIVPSRR